jgi:2-keto-3-deoxy-L-rhamnonate aldolase RhmA
MVSEIAALSDPFVDVDGLPRVLNGVAVITGSAKIAEMAGRLGFEAVWIEVEHGGASFSEVEALCVASEAGGAVPCVRVPDANRTHILRSLEAGARIVIVPMVNDAQTAEEVVRHGKFPPLGQRGFNTRSRGLNYGLDGMENLAQTFARANASTHLICQIETVEAAQNVQAICNVPGVGGVLVGPGDLSASMGITGQFAHPDLIATVTHVLQTAKSSGKHAGILVAPGPLLSAAYAAGCDLAFIGGDINNLAAVWRGLLGHV